MKKIEEYQIQWNCRFHPTNWWHETGCPHMEWTLEQLQSALEILKKSNEYHLAIFSCIPKGLVATCRCGPGGCIGFCDPAQNP